MPRIFLFLRDVFGITHMHLNFIFTSFGSSDGYCHTYKHLLREMVLYYIWGEKVSTVWFHLTSLYQIKIYFFLLRNMKRGMRFCPLADWWFTGKTLPNWFILNNVSLYSEIGKYQHLYYHLILFWWWGWVSSENLSVPMCWHLRGIIAAWILCTDFKHTFHLKIWLCI